MYYQTALFLHYGMFMAQIGRQRYNIFPIYANFCTFFGERVNETEKWDREKEARRLTNSSRDKSRYALFQERTRGFYEGVSKRQIVNLLWLDPPK